MTAALKPLAAIAVLAFVLVCIVTVHGAAARDTGQTRVELFEPIARASKGMPDEKCTEFLIMVTSHGAPGDDVFNRTTAYIIIPHPVKSI